MLISYSEWSDVSRNQYELELNVTHQFLVYADDVHVLRKT